MFILVSITRTIGFYLAMFFTQSNLIVKRKRVFALSAIPFLALDILIYPKGYFGFLVLVVSVFFIELIAFKNSNFKSILNTGIVMCVCFIARIITSTYFLLFRKENFFKYIMNGFVNITPILLTFFIFFLIIFIQRHLTSRLKRNYSISNRYYARIVFIDSIMMLPMFFALNMLYRYAIRHSDEILGIENLNYIFLIFLLSVIIIGLFFMYIINAFLLSRKKFTLMLTEAEYDELTQVYNRKSGMKKLLDTFEYNKMYKLNFVVCFLDVNNLKTVNDRFGHPAGDELIKTVATIAKDSLRNVDFMIRYGGDEFIIIFQDCSINDAKNAWKRIRDSYEKINYESDKPYRITVSAGFASMDEHSDFDAEELIDVADRRMYRNKKIYKSQIQETQS